MNVIPILIPPLRQRRADIPELCLYFATKFSDKRSISFTPETLELLSKYDWPGNVREVANLVKRLSVLSSSDSIDLYNIPDALLPKMLLEIRNDFASKVSSHDHHVEGETQKISQSAPPNDSSDGFEEESELPQPPIPAEKSNACSATEVERIIRLSQSINQIPDSGIETKNLLQEIETNLIRAALDQSEGNVSQAAKLLKIGRTTLIQKLDKHRND